MAPRFTLSLPDHKAHGSFVFACAQSPLSGSLLLALHTLSDSRPCSLSLQSGQGPREGGPLVPGPSFQAPLISSPLSLGTQFSSPEAPPLFSKM